MEFRKLIIAMIAGAFAFSFTPSTYAATDELTDGVNVNIYQIIGEIVGGEDVDESVLPPSDEEYVIDSRTDPIYEPTEYGGITTSLSGGTVRDTYLEKSFKIKEGDAG